MDPFTLLHNTIKEQTVASKAVQAAVSNYAHNIISGNEARLAELDMLTTSDTPELLLMASSTSGQVMFSSSSTNFKQTFSWRITTGDQRPGHIAYPVSFALLCCITELCYGNLLRGLAWRENPFVLSTELDEIAHDIDGEGERGVKGYATLFSMTCELQFPRNSLLEFNKGEQINAN